MHSRAIWQGCAQQRVFAVDPLVRNAGDLFGEALDQPVINLRRINPLHPRIRRILDPHLAGAVDHDFSHGVTIKPAAERGKVGVKIDAAFSA